MEKYDYIAYTDGSCDCPGTRCGGSAYIILKNDMIIKEVKKGFLNTSNNRMEMLAIISAINSVPEGSSILIHSDSQYAIKVLSGVWKAHTNKDLLNLHKKISKKRNVYFKWVKGHNGDKYNEMVDKLAASSCQGAIKSSGMKGVYRNAYSRYTD